jgi:hypothetical protein
MAPDTSVIIRAYMNASAYAGQVVRETIQDGLFPAPSTPGFATELEVSVPLPEDCAFLKPSGAPPPARSRDSRRRIASERAFKYDQPLSVWLSVSPPSNRSLWGANATAGR